MNTDKHNVKKLRSKLKLTQQELADKLRVHKDTVSLWERGEQIPRPAHLRELARLARKVAQKGDTVASLAVHLQIAEAVAKFKGKE